MIYGYARVSAADQNLARQQEALSDVDVLIEEKASGASRKKRPELERLLWALRPGDTVRVKSADRLARNTRDLLDLVDEIIEKGAFIEFVDTPQLNVTSKEGRFILTIFAAFAEMERASIRERQAEGIAAAKAAGRYKRAVVLSEEQICFARDKVALGVPKASIARELGVSRPTLDAALNGTGAYAKKTDSSGGK